MKRILLFLASLILLAACGRNDEFTLTGTLAGGAGKMLYLEELTPDGPMFIDSIPLDTKGRFTYRYAMPYESFYNLHATETDYLMLIPRKGERISISADYNQVASTYEVSGSEESGLLWQLQRYSLMCADQLNEIVALDRNNRVTLSGADSLAARAYTDSLYRDLRDDMGNYLLDFLRRNRGSLATIIALYKPFNGDTPLIDPRHNLDWYEEVLSGLEEMKPTNPHTQHLALSVAALRHRYSTPQ